MDKCSYDRFDGMYNRTNGNIWFFGKCFVNIMEVIKIVDEVPKDYNDYIEISGLTCFTKTSTGQVWFNHKIYDNTKKAYQGITKLLNEGSGKTRLKRCRSRNDLDYLEL